MTFNIVIAWELTSVGLFLQLCFVRLDNLLSQVDADCSGLVHAGLVVQPNPRVRGMPLQGT